MSDRARRGISVSGASIESMAAAAAAADAAGLASVWTTELYNRSASITLAALAQATEKCTIGSGIMYGVGRSPLMLAAEARDLDELSHGRLILGLGNGTRRMISDWHGLDGDAPAVRMEELIPLLRKIWRLDEAPVSHDGRFYHVDIQALPDLALPAPRPIPIYTAGVNPRMIETAGRVSDGLLGHSLFSPAYIEQVVIPSIARGAERAGRDPAAVALATFVTASVHEDEEVARREAAAMLAFYGSVKTYGRLFEACGFGAEAATMQAAFKRGDVDALVAAVTDEMIAELAIAGTPTQVERGLGRFDGLVDDVILIPPTFRVSRERAAENLASLIECCAAPRH